MDETVRPYNPWDVPGIGDVAEKNGKRREVVEVFVHDNRVTYICDGELSNIRFTSWWSWAYDAVYTSPVEGAA